MTAPRQYLGGSVSVAGRANVFEGSDAFDIESTQNYEIVQRSVLYDDVRLVTYHREYGTTFMVVMGLLSFVTLGTALLIGIAAGWLAGAIMLVFAAPFVIPFLLRLWFKLDVITIFGRRSKATLQFRFRKKRAREVYGRICATVRAAQRAGAPPPSGAAEDVAHDEAGAVPLPDGADDGAADDDRVAPPA